MKKIKTAEEYIIALDFVSEEYGIEVLENPYEFNKEDILKTIKQAQLDMLEYAVNKAANNSTISLSRDNPKELSSSEVYCDAEWENYIFVDKQSILKTIDEIKKEL